MASGIEGITSTWAQYFTFDRREEKSTDYFFKALLGVTLLKVISLWAASSAILQEETILPRSWVGKIIFAPLYIAELNLDLFFVFYCVVLLLLFFLKRGYAVNLIFFILVASLYRLKAPVINGSDIVLLVFSLLAVPLISIQFGDPKFRHLSNGLYNWARVMIQIQVLLIYVISGIDKLQTEMWRNGDAFMHIQQIDLLYNPWFNFFSENKVVGWILGWLTIAFELLFPILVYVKRTRLWILCAGVIFHLIIWVMLSLPDFALVMILSYLIFIKDSDLVFARSKIKR